VISEEWKGAILLTLSDFLFIYLFICVSILKNLLISNALFAGHVVLSLFVNYL